MEWWPGPWDRDCVASAWQELWQLVEGTSHRTVAQQGEEGEKTPEPCCPPFFPSPAQALHYLSPIRNQRARGFHWLSPPRSASPGHRAGWKRVKCGTAQLKGRFRNTDSQLECRCPPRLEDERQREVWGLSDGGLSLGLWSGLAVPWLNLCWPSQEPGFTFCTSILWMGSHNHFELD